MKLTLLAVFDLGAYIPEALADKYDAFRESAVGFLSKVGVVRKAQVDNSAAEGELIRARPRK